MATPPGLPLPTAVQTALWMRWPNEFMNACSKRCGDTFRVDFAANPPIAVTSNPEYVRLVFTGNDDDLRFGEVNDYLAPLLGETSIFLCDGARHKRQRRLLLPPFHGERMRVYAQAMCDVTLARISTWRDGEPFALRDTCQDIALDLILRTIFGVEDPDEMRELGEALLRMMEVVESPVGSLGLIPALRFDFPGSPWRRFLRLRAAVDVQVYRAIARRRSQHGQGRTDMLSMMIASKDENGVAMTDAELRDELITMMVAGHETTATGVCWAFERMFATPRVYEQVQREVRSVCGGEPPSPDQLNRLEYLDAAIKEALRMRPVLALVARKLHAPLVFGKYEVPAGWIVAPSMYLTHHNPDAYPEPMEFRPERFLGVRPDPYAWFPFGGGSRRCLGLPFALYEMKVVIATILSRKQLSLAQRAPVRVQRRVITLVPSEGLRVTCASRPATYSVPASASASLSE
jgi:cytochrome P450